MSYHQALEAAGAEVVAFQEFGSYQGDWWAKVVYEGRTFWVHGSYGSCSGCDNFQAEFDYCDGDTCEEHRYKKGSHEQLACEACKTAPADYNKRLADFGRSYLTSGDMTQEEAEKSASQDIEWDDGAPAMLEFLKQNKLLGGTMNFNDTTTRHTVESNEQWREKIPAIPYIQFPKGWLVKVIPPFGGAVARFIVKLPDGDTKSIYLDCFDRLGIMGHPYWEVYPYRGDVGRCDIDDTKKLLQMIKSRAKR